MLARKSLFAALSYLPLALHAAEITWGPATNVSGDSDVSTNGVLIEAINAGHSSVTTARVVNGVPFESQSLLPSGSNIDFLPGAITGVGGDYELLLSDCDFGGGTIRTLSIGAGSLFSGLEYEVQVWFADNRPVVGERVMTFADGEGNSVDLAGHLGQFVTGTFTADGVSQDLRLESNGFANVHITAYQVRLLSPPPFAVTTLNDELDSPAGEELSLREAIRDSSPGEVILIAPELDGGTIQLDASLGELIIDKSLTIDASALPDGIIIDGGSNGDRVLNANETRCLFISDQRDDLIHDVTLVNLTIQNGVVQSIGDPDIGGQNGPFLKIQRAGANISNRENLTLIDCEILNGSALSIFDFDGDNAFPTGSAFSDPRGGGGGLFSSGGLLQMTRCLVSGNESIDAPGGGILIHEGEAQMELCQIEMNDGVQDFIFADGGGLHCSRGEVTLIACTVAENEVFGSFSSGGGISILQGVIKMEECSLIDNASGNRSGAVEATSSTGVFTRCTFTGNSAVDNGGACNFRFGSYTFLHCTIVENSTQEEGAIFGSFGGANPDTNFISLTSCIVRENVGGDIEASGPNLFISGGDNLVGTGSGLSVFAANEISLDPIHLAPLANYGGPTQTMPPLSNSPAVDAAEASTTTKDQRGFFVFGIPDIGAAEFKGVDSGGDSDGDGLVRVLELALGTDPDVADFTSLRRPVIGLNGNGDIELTFGRGSDFIEGSVLIVERSTSLAANSFEEVYRFALDAATGTNGNGIFSDEQVDKITMTDLADQLEPRQRAFYRLGVIFE